MVSLVLAVVLASVTSESVTHKDYASAYKESVSEDKPLMVVVSAPWCPACNVLKSSTIVPMAETGELDDVSVAVIDRDKDPELVGQLTKGETMLPQIIVYTKTTNGHWERRRLMGFQPRQPVRSLIRRGHLIGPRLNPSGDPMWFAKAIIGPVDLFLDLGKSVTSNDRTAIAPGNRRIGRA